MYSWERQGHNDFMSAIIYAMLPSQRFIIINQLYFAIQMISIRPQKLEANLTLASENAQYTHTKLDTQINNYINQIFLDLSILNIL